MTTRLRTPPVAPPAPRGGATRTRPRPARPAPRPETEATTPLRPQDRERRAGGPQDRALYPCRCGVTFSAAVTASVRCPHCGDQQAW